MIFVTCPCGQTMRLQDELGGRKVRCPLCLAVLGLPTVDAILLGGELPYGAKAARKSDDGFSHKPKSRPRRDDDDDDDDEDEEEEVKPKKKSKMLAKTPAAVSGKATAALILGLLTCCVPGIFTVLAMIFGIIAVVDINNEDKHLTGMGRAITGMVFSVVGVIVAAVFWFIVVPIAVPAIAFLGCMGAAVGVSAAMKTETTNNMKQIGLAAHSHNDQFKSLPTPSTPTGLSWRVTILPFIEQKAIFDQIDAKSAWNSPKNQFVQNLRPNIFNSKMHPSFAPSQTSFQTTVGANGLFRNKDEKITFKDITDGMSNTIYVIDVPSNHVNWMQPADLTIANGQPLPMGLMGPQSYLVLMADGSVRTVARPKTSENTLRQLMDRSDGKGQAGDLD